MGNIAYHLMKSGILIITHILAEYFNFADGCVIKTRNKVDKRTLARTRTADYSYTLSSFEFKVHVLQSRLGGIAVSERNIVKFQSGCVFVTALGTALAHIGFEFHNRRNPCRGRNRLCKRDDKLCQNDKRNQNLGQIVHESDHFALKHFAVPNSVSALLYNRDNRKIDNDVCQRIEQSRNTADLHIDSEKLGVRVRKIFDFLFLARKSAYNPHAA